MRRRYILILSAVLGVFLLIGAYFSLPSILGSVVVPWPEQYQQPLIEAAKKYNVDSCLGAATIQIESRWNPSARSGAGAGGLGQIVTGTFNAIGRKNEIDLSKGRYDAVTSINVMMAYHRYNIDQYGANIRNIAVAYNAGGGRVKLPNSALPFETRSYISKLSRHYQLYATVYPDLCTGPRIAGGSEVVSGSATKGEAFAEFSVPNSSSVISVEDFWKTFLSP